MTWMDRHATLALPYETGGTLCFLTMFECNIDELSMKLGHFVNIPYSKTPNGLNNIFQL